MDADKTLSIKMLLTLLQAEYPNSFANMDERTMKLKEELWTREFANDDLAVVYAAIRTYMRSPERFAPTIGQIREKMDDLMQPERLSEVDAWALVSKATRNGSFGFREEFQKLPEPVQRAVGSAEQLRTWAMMSSDTVESVIASNFMRTYRAKQKHEKELAMIPADVRQMLSGVADKLTFKAAELGKALPADTQAQSLEAEHAPVPAPEPVKLFFEQEAPQQEPWTPPTDEEWEKMRAEKMKMLERLGSR